MIAHPITQPVCESADLREQIATVIVGDIYGTPDGWVGPATRSARTDGLKKADAILAMLPRCGVQSASDELLDDPRVALGAIVDWWKHLPNDLRQDIEGSGRLPGCIARAERLATSLPSAEGK